MSRRKARAQKDGRAEIDLTPMLDVVFIMLIFFIVTASFVKEVGFDINVPEKDKQEQEVDPDKQNILVEVRANDEIWMERRRVDIRAVRANIERLHAEYPKAIVIVKADGKASAATYVAIADAAREAKVYNVALAPMNVER